MIWNEPYFVKSEFVCYDIFSYFCTKFNSWIIHNIAIDLYRTRLKRANRENIATSKKNVRKSDPFYSAYYKIVIFY